MWHLGERQIVVDCDVIQADGGTRCASITGGWVALKLAVNKLMKAGLVTSDPLVDPVAAISCGIYAGQEVLDLDYPEDSEAGVDGNFVMTAGKLIEVQMSAEGSIFTREQMDGLLDLAEKGVAELDGSTNGRGFLMRRLTEKNWLSRRTTKASWKKFSALLRPLALRCRRMRIMACLNQKRLKPRLSGTRGSRRMLRRRQRAYLHWPMIAASKLTAWAVRRVFIPPIGPKRPMAAIL